MSKLDGIKARWKAMLGPWEWSEDNYGDEHWFGGEGCGHHTIAVRDGASLIMAGNGREGDAPDAPDRVASRTMAAAIAAAPEDVAWLIGEVERLGEQLGSPVVLASDYDRAVARAEKAEAERDAYKKAKAENDERFMLERDEARAALDAATGDGDPLAIDPEDAAYFRDAATGEETET